MTVEGPLPRARKVALVREILLAYVHVRWLLRRHDLPTALERLRRVPAAAAAAAAPTDEKLARAVRLTLSRLPADSRCLMQSLVLTRLLARRGREATVVIGVEPRGTFTAHAWVERRGTPLLPPGDHEGGRLAEL